MFTLKWTGEASRQYGELRDAALTAQRTREGSGETKSSHAEGLLKQVAKAIQLLARNPRHPGLQTHEYRSLPHPYSDGEKVFEAYAQNRTPGAYRVFWCYGPEKKQITIVAITRHP